MKPEMEQAKEKTIETDPKKLFQIEILSCLWNYSGVGICGGTHD